MSGSISPARQCSTLEKGPWQQAVGYPAAFDVDNPSDHPLENRHAATERVHGSTARAISFGPFRLMPAQRLLLHAGKAVPLGSRALDILIALVERSKSGFRPGDQAMTD